MKDLYFIRHSKPIQKNQYCFIGQTDNELSKEGCELATELGKRLSISREACFISSPLKRALKTAKLAFPEANIQVSLEAVEQNFGILEGLSFSESKSLYPEAIAHLSKNPLNYGIVQGEEWNQLLQRAVLLLEKLEKNEQTVIFTHLFFINAIVEVLYGKYMGLQLSHCEGIRLSKVKSGKSWDLSRI